MKRNLVKLVTTLGSVRIRVVVSALRADSFEPQARRYSKSEHYHPLLLRLLEGDLSGLGNRERNLSRCGTKAARPSERARASQFKLGDKIKVTAKGDELVFEKK